MKKFSTFTLKISGRFDYLGFYQVDRYLESITLKVDH